MNSNETNDDIEQHSFADEPDQCFKRINHHIEEITKNHIKDFLQPDDITPQTELIMVIEAYFKGQWVCKFYIC